MDAGRTQGTLGLRQRRFRLLVRKAAWASAYLCQFPVPLKPHRGNWIQPRWELCTQRVYITAEVYSESIHHVHSKQYVNLVWLWRQERGKEVQKGERRWSTCQGYQLTKHPKKQSRERVVRALQSWHNQRSRRTVSPNSFVYKMYCPYGFRLLLVASK